MKRLFLVLLVFVSINMVAQDAPAGQQGRSGGERRRMMGPGVAGAITEINGDTIVVKSMEGTPTTIKISSSTQFRMDREPAKLADFKVGDMVFVGGEKDGANNWKAQFVAKRSGTAGSGGGMGDMREMLGKRFIAGEVTKIDETKLTVKRIDGETQVIEADENTSFHNDKRESITLADIKVGDKVSGRGEVKNGIFVPSTLNLGEMPMMRRGPAAERLGNNPAPANPNPEKRDQ